jgi:hypothetical protein
VISLSDCCQRLNTISAISNKVHRAYLTETSRSSPNVSKHDFSKDLEYYALLRGTPVWTLFVEAIGVVET